MASRVVGSCTKAMPRIQQAATKPERSPITPPPSAITVASRLAFIAARSPSASPKRARGFWLSPGGRMRVAQVRPASRACTRSR